MVADHSKVQQHQALQSFPDRIFPNENAQAYLNKYRYESASTLSFQKKNTTC